MYLKFKLLLFFLLSFMSADSPITSTIFYKNFLDIEIIKDANISKKLDEKGCTYLSSELNTIWVSKVIYLIDSSE